MAVCDVCGNEYDKTMEITIGGETKTFDSFDCCDHCAGQASG